MKTFLLKVYSNIQKKRGFKSYGSMSIIKYPSKIWSRDAISIGKDVFIAENSFFSVSKEYKGIKYSPEVIIGENTCIGSNFFLACIEKVEIGRNVLISDRVFISDHIHGYDDINVPIINQSLVKKGAVKISDDCFIGINSVIMPGVTIGKHSVIGASSVVIKNVPDFTVVTGNPAKIIKKYDKKTKTWNSVDIK